MQKMPESKPNIDVMDKTLGLTKEEDDCMKCLSEAANKFMALSEYHQSDKHEFVTAIHAAQLLIAYRVAKRVNPEIWN